MTHTVLRARLGNALALTNDLAAELSAESLKRRNGQSRSNSIGAQFWCLIGARESYARAFRDGAWSGFACSLDRHDIANPKAVQEALLSSQRLVQQSLDMTDQSEVDDARTNILLDLVEHEVQHHGQLIRYFYANDIPFPPSFASRYHL
jgi:uncharacterized damage-inducible protein DinB